MPWDASWNKRNPLIKYKNVTVNVGLKAVQDDGLLTMYLSCDAKELSKIMINETLIMRISTANF